MKKLLIFSFIILLAGAGYWYFIYQKKADAKTVYEFAEVTRGNIENLISSTGTIQPVRTVEVGTEVSGKIEKVNVDFNDMVKKGQVLAILDTTFLSSAVRDAQASIVRAEAQYHKSQKDYEFNKQLFDKQLASELELLGVETTMKTNYASLQSAKSALERSQFNFDHAVIRSPISGKVINRNIEEGQTVQASFSTPTLFLIAENLAKIEIHARVDESDIGQIREGQEVRFTVEAYFDKEFSGAVRQVRLQPQTISNVVTYTVVVDAENTESLLMPGMTATVEFVVDKKENVLLVPNSALRVQPTEEMLASMRARWEGRRGEGEAYAGQGRPRPGGGNYDRNAGGGFQRNGGGNFQINQGEGSQRNMSDRMARLWTKDDKGDYSVIMARKGITDGKMTEILENERLQEGMQLVSNVIQPTTAAQATPNRGMDMRVMGRVMGGR